MTDEINITGSSAPPLGKAKAARGPSAYTTQAQQLRLQNLEARNRMAETQIAAQQSKALLAAAKLQSYLGSRPELAASVSAAGPTTGRGPLPESYIKANRSTTQEIVRQSQLRQRSMRESLRTENAAWAENDRINKKSWASFVQDARDEDKRRAAESKKAYRMSPAYFRDQEMKALGTRGAQAINAGNIKEFLLIDRHLAKMDKNLDKYVKSNGLSGQEQEARRKQSRDILAGSYAQMQAAVAEAPGIKGFVARSILAARASAAGGGGGRGGVGGGLPGAGGASGGGGGGLFGRVGMAGLGAVGALLEMAGPVGAALGTAGAVAGAIYEAPGAIADIYQSAYKGAQPYYNLQQTAGRMGAAGGFSSADLINAIYKGGQKGATAPAWMQQYGLGPQDVLDLAQQYGPLGRSAAQVIGNAQFMAALRYNPATANMNPADLMGFANTQATASSNRDKALADYQRVMTTAVATGSDQSKVNQNLLGVMQQLASAGANVQGAGFANTFSNMMTSGYAGAKTGTMQANWAAGIINAATSTNMSVTNPQNAIMANYIQQHGGYAASAQTILKNIGQTDILNQLSGSAAGRLQLSAYNAAVPAQKAQMLSSMLISNPDFLNTVYTTGLMRAGPAIGLQAAAQMTGNNYATAAVGLMSGITPPAVAPGGLPPGLNNPGNMMIPGTNIRQSYATAQEGVKAMRDQLLRYQDIHGLNTVAGIVGRWDARSDPNHAAYIKNVTDWMKQAGYTGKLNLHDPKVMANLMADMSRQEGNGVMTPAQVTDFLAGKGPANLITASSAEFVASTQTNQANMLGGNPLKAMADQLSTAMAQQNAIELGKLLEKMAKNAMTVTTDAMTVTATAVKIVSTAVEDLTHPGMGAKTATIGQGIGHRSGLKSK